MTAVCVAAAVGFFHWNAVRKAASAHELVASAFIQTAGVTLKREFQVAAGQLHQLTETSSLGAFVEAPSSTTRAALDTDLYHFAETEPLVERVYLLDGEGHERARVTKIAGTPRVAAVQTLQDHAGLEWYQHARDAVAGHVRIVPSGADESDPTEASAPRRLHFAVALPESAGAGLLVADYLSDDLLERLAPLEGSLGQVHMLDGDGSWILGPNTGVSFPERYPDLWAKLSQESSGQTQSESGFLTFEELHSLEGLQLLATGPTPWKLLSLFPASELRAALIARAQLGLLQWALLVAALTPGCWLFAVTRHWQAGALSSLVRSERRLLSLMESAPDAILTLDHHERVVTWNRAADELFRLEGRDIRGEPLSRFVSDPDPECKERLTAHPARGARELLGLSAAGSTIPIELTLGRWEEDATKFTVVIARDVTPRRTTELQAESLRSELDQARKLEAVGLLAAGIAHEVNTPTQFVGDNTRFPKESFEDIGGLLAATLRSIELVENSDEPQARRIAAELRKELNEADVDFLQEEIPRAIEQSIQVLEPVSKIVRTMKDFAHPGCGDKASVDLNQCVESTVSVATNEWRYSCELHLELDPALPRVHCRTSEINQAILNVVVNASHAVQERLGERPETKGNIWISSQLIGAEVVLRFRDDGAGIPLGARGRIFDPFFTTKAVGRGAGQGLAIAHDIITRRHGGSIEFETELGVGTCITLRLPLALEGANIVEALDPETGAAAC